MGVPLFHVDAFASAPFTGNPAAVCLLEEAADEAWMQAVAAEMNLSETAFARARDDTTFDLRWFTPTVEAELCGHATLATAHVLWETERVGAGAPVRFQTRSGLLTAAHGAAGIELDLPADPPEDVSPVPPVLLPALGVDARTVARARVGYLVEVADETTVRGVDPDFAGLTTLRPNGIVVTSAAPPGAAYDFVSRYFAPAAGIDEDPATGSAHCALGPYWAARLHRDELTGCQVSARGAMVGVRMNGGRVTLVGRAVTVLRGELADVAEGLPARGSQPGLRGSGERPGGRAPANPIGDGPAPERARPR
jgi:predicted PhzF superfamily epimerase YddE/YHI9